MNHTHMHTEELEPLEKSILKPRVAGDAHHMRELQKLESLMFSDFNVHKLYEDVETFIDKTFPETTANTVTVKDLQKIDTFVKAQTLTKITAIEQYIVRAFVIGHILQEREGLPTLNTKEIELKKLPSTVSQAMKTYGLTEREAFSLENTKSYATQNLVSATNTTINKVQSLLSDSLIKQTGRKKLKSDLLEAFEDDSQEVNRNWNRVAITCTSYAFNNGYLSTLAVDSWVVGISMPDRCEHCGQLIDGKVYPYIGTTNAAMDCSNLEVGSKEYERRIWIAKHCIWLGKDNYGRSGAKRKRTADGMVERDEHESYVPAIPVHPYCFKADSMVMMSDGSHKKIQDIAIGEKVISGRGKIQRVIAKSKNDYVGQFNTIQTAEGSHLESTGDHKVMIQRNGEFYWAEAHEIVAGDCIVRLKPTVINKDELVYKYDIEKRSVLQLSKEYEVSRDTINRKLIASGCELRGGSEANVIRFKDPVQRKQATAKAHRIIAEKAAKGEWAIWIKGKQGWSHGLTKETNESIARISESKMGAKNPMYGKVMQENVNFTTGKKSYRRHFMRNKSQRECNRCKAGGKLHIHHADRNRDNNSLDNLEILCPSCHSLEHQADKKRERNAKGQFQPEV